MENDLFVKKKKKTDVTAAKTPLACNTTTYSVTRIFLYLSGLTNWCQVCNNKH